MDVRGLISLGAVVIWFGGFILFFSYPVLRLRPLLDEGTGRFNPLLCILRGQYQGRPVSFQYKAGSRTGGPPRFLMSMQLRRANVIQPEKQAALEQAHIFMGIPRRPRGAKGPAPAYGYVTSQSNTPWAEPWFIQPEVKQTLDDLFGPRQLQEVWLEKGTLKGKAFSPWKTSRPENVQPILEHFVTLEGSLPSV